MSSWLTTTEYYLLSITGHTVFLLHNGMWNKEELSNCQIGIYIFYYVYQWTLLSDCGMEQGRVSLFYWPWGYIIELYWCIDISLLQHFKIYAEWTCIITEMHWEQDRVYGRFSVFLPSFSFWSYSSLYTHINTPQTFACILYIY